MLEAIHQHFIRNHVGNTLCDPHCLQVVSVAEDRSQGSTAATTTALPLPKKGDSVFIHGLRVMGHLQLNVVLSPAKDRKKSVQASTTGSSTSSSAEPSVEIRPEGVPVVLEVSSACMATTSSSATSPQYHARSASASGSFRSLEGANALSSQVEAFLCPIHRSDTTVGSPQHYEAQIYVLTTLPHAELVLSGSSLHISSFRTE